MGFYAVFLLAFSLVFFAEVKGLENSVYFGVYWLKFHLSHSYQRSAKHGANNRNKGKNNAQKNLPKLGGCVIKFITYCLKAAIMQIIGNNNKVITVNALIRL